MFCLCVLFSSVSSIYFCACLCMCVIFYVTTPAQICFVFLLVCFFVVFEILGVTLFVLHRCHTNRYLVVLVLGRDMIVLLLCIMEVEVPITCHVS